LARHGATVLTLASILPESKLLGGVVLHGRMGLRSTDTVSGEALSCSVGKVVGERS
jgi:hypothetical protein